MAVIATPAGPRGLGRILTDLRIRWMLLIAVTVVAYWFSLTTIWANLGSQEPLAYIGLVPILAAVVAWIRPARRIGTAGTDTEFDVLIGLGLMLPAIIGMTILPVQLGPAYWAYRVDMLTLPLFLAGGVTLLFGYDALRMVKLPLALTVLAWPYPYYLALGQPVQQLAAATSTVVGQISMLIHAGTPTALPGVFSVPTPHGLAYVAIGVTCAGLTGLVGFGLLGMIGMIVAEGSRARKLAWWLTGLVLSFTANVIRIVLLIVVTGAWDANTAMNLIHPVAGLILDAAVFVVMLALLGRFGLRVPPMDPARWRPFKATPMAPAGLVLLAVFAAIVGAADGELQALSPFTGSDGNARIASFVTAPAAPAGWTVGHAATYDWARQYFGADSTFQRFVFTNPDGRTVWADVVTTSGPALTQYTVESCLAFHGDQVLSINKVPLAGAMSATSLTYHEAHRAAAWNVIYWVWPVVKDGRRYEERIWLSSLAGGKTSGGPDAAALAPQTSAFDQVRYGVVNSVFTWSFAGKGATPVDPSFVTFAQSLAGRLVSA